MKPIYTIKLKLLYKIIFTLGMLMFLGMSIGFYLNTEEMKPLASIIMQTIFLGFAFLIFLVLALLPRINVYPDYFEITNWFGYQKEKNFKQDRSGYFTYNYKDRYGNVKFNFYLLLKTRDQIEIPISYYQNEDEVIRYLTQDIPFLEDNKKVKVSQIYNVRGLIFYLIAFILSIILVQMIFQGMENSIHNYLAYLVLGVLIILSVFIGSYKKWFK